MLFITIAAIFLFISPIQSYPSPQEYAERRSAQVFTGDGTFYDPGLGACGITSSSNDFIVALNKEQFDAFPGNPNFNPFCGKQVDISFGGKTITCTVVDRCDGCLFGSLDLSPAAFQALADPSLGRIKISWTFCDGNGPPPDHGPDGQKHPDHGPDGQKHPDHGPDGQKHPDHEDVPDTTTTPDITPDTTPDVDATTDDSTPTTTTIDVEVDSTSITATTTTTEVDVNPTITTTADVDT
ncbi:14213_t:CDS:2 [Acaulospora morrowiae]|uniref:14213_t:CDS:1 n=1 Tax=Acaulospora morrowiae TaxID=94023 RepID=A0A9N9AU13_9GLOM|nr:14213_t:CDS:2 [Acaulospora morrowiae]